MGSLKTHYGVIVRQDTGYPVSLFTAESKEPINRAIRFHEKRLGIPLEFARIHAVAYHALEDAQINREPYLGYCLASIDSHKDHQRMPPRPPVIEVIPSKGVLRIRLGTSVQRLSYWVALLWPGDKQVQMRYRIWKRMIQCNWDVWRSLTAPPGEQGKARKKPPKAIDPILHLAQSARW